MSHFKNRGYHYPYLHHDDPQAHAKYVLDSMGYQSPPPSYTNTSSSEDEDKNENTSLIRT